MSPRGAQVDVNGQTHAERAPSGVRAVSAVLRVQSPVPESLVRVGFFTQEVKTLYHHGMTSTISAKGQITVPKAVRDELGLRPGALVEFELTGEGALLRKGHRGGVRAVDRVLGILKREAPTDSLIDAMRGPAPASVRRRRWRRPSIRWCSSICSSR